MAKTKQTTKRTQRGKSKSSGLAAVTTRENRGSSKKRVVKSSSKRPISGRGTPSASQAVDSLLARYREMRDFEITKEPRGATGKKESPARRDLPFVIQKHAATRLHYDFRLGLHGVLKSWAITKGPSYFPGDKRLAVQVEDHPMEYGGFEGIIPKGQYGGGTVMLWDEGTWEPVGDPDEGLAKGNLKFILHGQKLKGKWVLVRMGGRAAAKEPKPNWLLIKEHDDYERGASDPTIVDERPDSVITQRSMPEIARAEDHVWDSKPRGATGDQQSAPGGLRASEERNTLPEKLPGAKQKMPHFIPPQLASQAARAPAGGDWLHELKLDGYRIQANIVARKVTLFTRSGLDWTNRMRSVARELERLHVDNAVLDGEVVVLDANGQSSFAELQAAFDEGRPNPLTYYVFDLLYLNGHSLLKEELIERKELLSKVLLGLSESNTVRLSQHIQGDGERMFHEACRLGAEGIISKFASGAYVSGRTATWVKLKCIRQQEFVIGGFTLPSNGSDGVGALLLGYYEDGRLMYAGRTGTGFTQTSSALLRKKLEALLQEKSSFAQMSTAGKRGAAFVQPKLVAQVQFRTWTSDHLVRQASFKGLREDKPAKEVRREEPDAKLTAKTTEIAPADAKTTHEMRRKSVRGKSALKKAQPDKTVAVLVTHPDRVIDPQSGLTKQALVDYYLAVSQRMLPHISDRPLSLVRCPGGAGTKCFYQKHTGQGLPRGVHGVDIPNKNKPGSEEYVTLSTAEGLAGLGQMNVLEVHPWGSTNRDLEHPDRIIIDLDPDDEISWPTLCDSAQEVRERLAQTGLESFLKSTGGKGLHIVAPLTPKRDWATVKAFTRAFTLQMEAENKLYISKMSKAARKNRIFVDYLRNERGATAIAVYSPRARLGITAAVPLDWSELKNSDRPHFAVAEFEQWSSRLKRDPWAAMTETHQVIKPEILEKMIDER